jgi:enoyl-CoA hydratase/carnithine racemase
LSEQGIGRIRTEVEGAVGWITIDNPTKANTLDLELVRALHDAWQWAEADDGVRAIVLTATGDRHFCAGINLGLVGDPSTLAADKASRSYTARDCGVTKPVIAAVNGAVLGAGLGFITGSDVVIAARHATFLDPHVRLAQITGFTGIRLGRQLPASEFTHSLLGAIPMTAERAHALGLVAEVHVSADDARTAAGELASRMAQHSPTAVRNNLALLRKLVWGEGDDPLVEEAMTTQSAHFAHPDSAEGLAAFAEKRPGRWAPVAKTGSRQ